MKSALFALFVLFGFGASAQESSAPPDPKQTGPTTLVILYRCAPAQRPQLREQVMHTGLRRFEDFRAQGILAKYRILFSRYVDTNNWDMLALLSFSNYTNFTAWKKVERTSPGGLSPETLALTTAINSYPVDRMRGNATTTVPPDPVFLVVPYTFSVSAPDYLKYADDYVTPQFDGWLAEGVLAGYDIFLQRYSASRPWGSLILLEYRDDESLGARERVVAKVRQRLQSNAAWRAIAQNKQSVRVEKEAVVADELAIRH
ncbi:MAG: hypothetical protein ACR2NN_09365 [Bryobacteraceae bacterium]